MHESCTWLNVVIRVMPPAPAVYAFTGHPYGTLIAGSTPFCPTINLNVQALVLGKFGSNKSYSVCRYKNPDTTNRATIWLIGWLQRNRVLSHGEYRLERLSPRPTPWLRLIMMLTWFYTTQRSTEAVFMPFIHWLPNPVTVLMYY